MSDTSPGSSPACATSSTCGASTTSTTSATSSSTPRVEPRCPLCGGPNGCAPAAAGRFDVACWCTEVRFSSEVLARIPTEQRGRACLCRRCAEGAVSSAVSSTDTGDTPAP